MGELTVLGLGPGDKMKRTLEVQRALEEAELIVGYSGYVTPLRAEFPEKPFMESGMTRELDRCRAALREAAGGRKVVLVSSGDASVFGMAGPVLELAPGYPGAKVRILPGVTAALSGAALLGAPLAHDFAVISLSDRLTPFEVIGKRLRFAAEAGFVVVLYNPGSRSRRGYLRRACDILLETLPGETVCGIARQIGREEESVEIMTLRCLSEREADMFTTVFIGNPSTRAEDGKMITPRGYAPGEMARREDGQ